MRHTSAHLSAAMAVLLLSAACGADLPHGVVAGGAGVATASIIGGTPCADGDHPAVGALVTKGLAPVGEPPTLTAIGKVFCTGTLIAPDVVLTAAHCTEIEETFYGGVGQQLEHYFTLARDVRYFFGDLVVPEQSFRIRAFIRHPQYDRAGFDLYPVGLAELSDIGLAFLQTPLTDVAPAVVVEPDDSASVTLGAALQIVGYGQMVNYGSTGMKAAAESFINELNDTEMQVGDAPPTAVKCIGDSGGPSFIEVDDGKPPRQRLVGTTSRAYDETVCETGGIDTRVDAYWDWIDSMMRAACNNGTRSDCAGGGGLASPGGASADAGVADDATTGGEEPAPAGCDCAAGESRSDRVTALATLLVGVVLRRRSRRRPT